MTKKSIKQPKGIILKGLTISLINPEGIAKPLGLIIYWFFWYVKLQYNVIVCAILLCNIATQ